MAWQGGAVIILLALSAICSKLIKSRPRDLIFTIGALLTALLGIVHSGQICQAFANQPMLAVLGLWCFFTAALELRLFPIDLAATLPWKAYALLLLLAGALAVISLGSSIGTSFFCAGLALLLFRPFPIHQTFRQKFPLPLLLEIFSAYLFYFALHNTGIDAWMGSFFQDFPFWAFLLASFLAAQAFAFAMPRPVAFAVIFSTARVLLAGPLLFIAGATVALSLIFFDRFAIRSCFFSRTEKQFL